ncbi:MAG: MG2 domain-containing protein [bacterium]
MKFSMAWISAVMLGLHALCVSAQSDTQLGDAKKLFDEKSWQLALEKYQEAAKSTQDTGLKREAQFMAGRALQELGRQDDAQRAYEADANGNDIWAGRALWRMTEAMLNSNAQYSSEDSRTSMIAQLRRAGEILTREKAGDLADFYQMIGFRCVSQLGTSKADERAFFFSAYDKRIALLKDKDQIAETLLEKASHYRYLNYDAPISEWMRQLRQITAEFPETRSARNAQMMIGVYYSNRNDLVKSLQEYRIAADRWPGTDEGKAADQQIDEIIGEQVSFTLGSSYLSGQPLTFELRGRNVSRVKITAVPFDPMALLNSQRREQLDLAGVTGEPAITKTAEIIKRNDYQATTMTVKLEAPRTGCYALRAESGKASARGMLIVSDLLIVSNNASRALELWTVNAATGRPRPAQLLVASDPQHNSIIKGASNGRYYNKIGEMRSDADGFADLRPAGNESLSVFIVARDGDHYAIMQTGSWFTSTHAESTKTYIYTDRPVYRPGQKMAWRAIIRNEKDGEYVSPSDRQYDVTIRDSRGAEVLNNKNAEVNNFGALSGELTLDSKPALGEYSIEIRKAGKDLQGYARFRVEEYKKPEFEVNVTSAEKLYRYGSKIRAKVDAKYYFGGAVANAEVKYTVRRQPRWSFWIDRFWPDSGNRDLGWFDKPAGEQIPRHGGSGTIVSTGGGKTDANGNYEIEFIAEKPPKEENERYRSWWQRQISHEFKVEATVTDQSRRNIDGVANFVVGDRAIEVSVKPQNHLYTPGDLVKADLQSRNLNEEPVASSGTLYVERVKWLEAEQKEQVTTISTRRVDIGASGSLIATWRVPAGETGRMRFLLLVDDPFGLKSQVYGEFTVADDSTRDIFYKYQGIQLTADRDIYEIGETARVMITSELRDAVAWYWIDSGSGNLEKKILPLPDHTNFIRIPITAGFVPNSMIHVAAVSNNKVISDQKELIVPPLRKVLNVTVKTDKDGYRPGQEGSVEIRATDYQGNPVNAEFSLAMFDRSILYISPDKREDIRRFFYGQRRELRANIGQSADDPGRYNSRMPDKWSQYLFRDPSETNIGQAQRDLGLARGQLGEAQQYSLGFGASRDYNFRLAAAPALAPMAAGEHMLKESKDSMGDVWPVKGAAGEVANRKEPQMAEAKARSDFRDSMFWSPTIVTDAQGSATAKVKFPDSLTTWRAVAVGLTPDTIVGNANTETVVTKNLLARLEAPRFFRERDRVTISGIVHNYLKSEKEVRAILTVKGLSLEGGASVSSQQAAMTAEKRVRIKPNAEERVDWQVDVKDSGEAVIELKALTDEESDAVEQKFPVLPHGIDKFVAWNGSTDDKTTTGMTIDKSGKTTTITQVVELPDERIKSSTRLTITVNPSLAAAIRDAIPCLIDYPYGCVEQTMSRFMPAAIAAQTFRDLNIPRDEMLEAKLVDVVKAGLDRITDFQHGDGGWGWWKDGGTDDYMTAYVMYGLTLARGAKCAVDEAMFQRGLEYMRRHIREYKDTDDTNNYWVRGGTHALMYQIFVLSLNNDIQKEALDQVWKHREKLTGQGLAMLARALWRADRKDDARVVLRNLRNFAVITPENNTARWGRIDQAWWWWEDAVEATAQGLQAYLEIAPDDPMTQQAMKWLALNRQGAQWKSTKDTAQAVLALLAYMKDRKETASEMKIEIAAGKPGEKNFITRTFDLNPGNFWKFDGKFVIEGDATPDGRFPVTITKTGDGMLFYSVYAEYFTLEENIKAAGNEIFVERVYERVVREQVKGTTGVAAIDKYVPIKDGETVVSGDELRVTLKIKSLNDYEYIVFEDAKPAGMEPVAVQSGYQYSGLASHMELRDQYVSFFMSRLPQGTNTVAYNCRAEIPGVFHTMPSKGYAMYFPPLRANSDEIIIKVKDK